MVTGNRKDQPHTDAFAFVVPEAATTVFSDDAFFAKVVQGVSEECGRAGKQLLLMLAPTHDSYTSIEQFVTAGHVDGVILVSMHVSDPLPAALIEAGIPFVACGKPLGTPSIPYVDVHHEKAVHDAVAYLYGSGRRHVATITGPQDMEAGICRLNGYLAAVKEAGEPAIVAHGDFTRESGIQAMHEVIVGGEPVDAVVVASDLMALGAMFLLRQAGMRVPEDIAVIGFDDIDDARFADPPLTTIRQPIQEIGVHLARQVIRLAAGESVEPAVMLPTELIVRKSA
jgi:DNA-binding LacI/PurR family transcriptional regulator